MAGRYQAYPEYKDSGVEWLGEVPEHWDVTRVKYVTKCLDCARIPLNSEERGNRQGNIPYWGANQIVDYVDNYIFDEELILLGEDGAPFFDPFRDVAFNVSGKIWPNNHVHVLRPNKEIVDSVFVKYALNSADFHLYISGSTRDKLNQSDMGEIYIRFCNLPEQHQIATFLDHETAKIDTLIEKQQRLISLLKEKRQAVISHAVTKGLNPDAPMKDSGVEWLGEVPAHWKVIKFPHCTSIRNGQVDPKIKPYCDFILIAPNHIESKTGQLLATETAAYQGADSGKYLCKKGEIIYSKIRPALTKVCLSPSDETICSADMYPIQAMYGLTNRFLYWTLLSDWFTCLAVLESDRVAMPKINREKLAEVKLLVPPSDEQLEICSYVFKKTESIDKLIEKAQHSIDLSKERRTAIISAAVTGKIDVRDWQPPSNHGNIQ
jgi:type I restriction enzyme, S subunit